MVSANELAAWPPELLNAVRRNAEFQADLTAACLDVLDQRIRDAGYAEGCKRLPRAFLLEFAAVAQLKHWELQGLGELLPSDVPSAAEASRDLYHRTTTDPDQFWHDDKTPLSRQVMQIWIEYFHWLEPGLVEAEIIVGHADEDLLIETLAQLLWQNRHAVAPASQLD